ncbi:MAG: tRNA (adenosine(37)-N6)-dimethylallyltransferase MiaA [Oscillospiraceae bacterium]|nr:tRNA (adenosine(37)-N6)-dimethylallyltransferase MiaA [Oscillospiraceae bacterium]
MKGLLVITGPTATGKSDLGVIMAERLDGEIVSADSMQIYRGMRIGTAAPTREEMRGVPHHLIGTVDPTEAYSAARYVEEASACVDDILARGKLPIVVGGTGLYIDSLLCSRIFPGGDGALRRRFSAQYDELGGEAMLAMLAEADPESAARLAANDKKRIVRALEVYHSTGKTVTQHNRETAQLPPRYLYCKIALDYADRNVLYGRIDARVDEMLRQGLVNEVRSLLESGLEENSTAMQAIGYKELIPALRGECSVADAAELIKRESRRYAKRQLSWLRSRRDADWIIWEKNRDYAKAALISTQLLEEKGII